MKTDTGYEATIRRLPGGAIDVDYYERQAKLARAEVLANVARGVASVVRSATRAMWPVRPSKVDGGPVRPLSAS